MIHKYRITSIYLLLQVGVFMTLSSCVNTNARETNEIKDVGRSQIGQRTWCAAPFVDRIGCKFNSTEWENFVEYLDRNRTLRRSRIDSTIYLSTVFDHSFLIQVEKSDIENGYQTRLRYYQDMDDNVVSRTQVIMAAGYYMQVEGRVDSTGSTIWDIGMKKLVLYSQTCESPLNAMRVYDYCGYYERQHIIE